jgi:hypothetical protein
MNAKEFIQALKDGKKLINRTRNLKADASLIYALVIHASDLTFEFEGIKEEWEFGVTVYNNGYAVGTLETNDWVIA